MALSNWQIKVDVYAYPNINKETFRCGRLPFDQLISTLKISAQYIINMVTKQMATNTHT